MEIIYEPYKYYSGPYPKCAICKQEIMLNEKVIKVIRKREVKGVGHFFLHKNCVIKL